jgi:predicted RNase H-like nuclease (RuvC/YqgF family)
MNMIRFKKLFNEDEKQDLLNGIKYLKTDLEYARKKMDQYVAQKRETENMEEKIKKLEQQIKDKTAKLNNLK